MVLGVTGSVAAGKSTVVRMLADRGAVVVDADQLAREAVAPGTSGLKQLVARFGTDILLADGALDRSKLREIIFHDDAARAEVNAITPAAIRKLAEQRLAHLRQKASLVVYESPLLFEAGAEGRVDRVLAVVAPEGERLKRLLARPGMTPELAAAMTAAQLPQEEKAARANYVLDTGGTLEEVAAKVGRLWEVLGADGIVGTKEAGSPG
ncbi:MAG: dephospho-CoA kinase [Deltaproteobacteria bacterium]|nr:dephospho-CoA kinase [Deltaproteobacteria bacterium]